ncbi:MAG: hypothetical protein HYS23_06055 [Geobacter sp.]|nr:hypothetical protein [Geobacter sp.]
MKPFAKVLVVAAFACVMFVPMVSLAQEEVPTEKEVKQAENEPPVIPHRVQESDTAKECLACHKTGKKGAPVTPHPERKACTQCHVPTAGFTINKKVKGVKTK